MSLIATSAVCQPHLSEAAGRLQTINEKMWPTECHKELASHFMREEISEPGNSITLSVKSPLFLVHSTITPYYRAAFISSSALTIIVLQMLPILFSICHSLKCNLGRIHHQTLCLQYAWILVSYLACCAHFLYWWKSVWARFLALSALFVIIN